MYQWFFAAVVPEGGRAFLVADSPCLQLTFFPPSPLPPFPAGRGRFLLYFAGATAPGTPALDRLQHLQLLPSMSPVGGLPSLLPANPAFSFASCPHPPAPLPGGKGETKSLFRRGLRPRHPGIKPFAALIDFVAVVPCGWLALFAARQPCLSLAFLPLSPPPPLPGGKGGNQGYFMQGASPLASPALDRLRHLQNLPNGYPAGACFLCRLPTLPLACFPAPYPPVPLPRRGRGRLKVYFAGGSAPGTPALNHLRHLRNPPSKCPAEENLLGVACPAAAVPGGGGAGK